MSNTEMLQSIIEWVKEAKKAIHDGREDDVIEKLNDIRTAADRLLGQI